MNLSYDEKGVLMYQPKFVSLLAPTSIYVRGCVKTDYGMDHSFYLYKELLLFFFLSFFNSSE